MIEAGWYAQVMHSRELSRLLGSWGVSQLQELGDIGHLLCFPADVCKAIEASILAVLHQCSDRAGLLLWARGDKGYAAVQQAVSKVIVLAGSREDAALDVIARDAAGSAILLDMLKQTQRKLGRRASKWQLVSLWSWSFPIPTCA